MAPASGTWFPCLVDRPANNAEGVRMPPGKSLRANPMVLCGFMAPKGPLCFQGRCLCGKSGHQ